ncbi:hypothetical protein AB1Y20_017761 [Prymnesium parvum]|uniref:Uncharacterized protein n=1 Tax=Prymnesium parvum TaxID=97485 RepID=A0AB34JQ74_PRYPA
MADGDVSVGWASELRGEPDGMSVDEVDLGKDGDFTGSGPYGPGVAHIPGYSGYQPGKRDKIGLSSTEASREILRSLSASHDFHPLLPLTGKREDSVYFAQIDKDGAPSVMDGFVMTAQGNVGAKVVVNRKFVPARDRHEAEAEAAVRHHSDVHARAPFGVDPTGTPLGKVDYTSMQSVGPGKFARESVASRVARRRLDRPRNEAGRLYRHDDFSPVPNL